MSIEALERLEEKIQQTIDTITLLQMEIEELKEKNSILLNEIQIVKNNRDSLEKENYQLREQHQGWQIKLQDLINRIEKSNI